MAKEEVIISHPCFYASTFIKRQRFPIQNRCVYPLLMELLTFVFLPHRTCTYGLLYMFCEPIDPPFNEVKLIENYQLSK